MTLLPLVLIILGVVLIGVSFIIIRDCLRHERMAAKLEARHAQEIYSMNSEEVKELGEKAMEGIATGLNERQYLALRKRLGSNLREFEERREGKG